MSRKSEKALKAMHQFLEENGAEDMSMDEVNGLLQQFMTDYNGRELSRCATACQG